jgi:hypothetical protein
MLKFAKLPIDEHLIYFQEVANRRGFRRLIVEKEFWVCFILRLLFENSYLEDKLILKGGTSLSKVFNIIKRFSEDLDLSVDPGWLGFEGDNHPEKVLSISRSQFTKRCNELNNACINVVKGKIQPILEAAICGVIDPPAPGKDFLTYEYDQKIKSPVLWFHYPTLENENQEYIQPKVKLELGSLTDQEPYNEHSIISWVAEEFPDEIRDPTIRVVSIDPERTFWEKATILHAEYHRPQEKPMRSHLSRDIYDVCLMANHEYGKKALERQDIRDRVVEYKKKYFHSGWKNFGTAKAGTFRLVPPDHRLSDLKNDFLKMEEMFFEKPPKFSDLINQLYEIEKIVNSC